MSETTATPTLEQLYTDISAAFAEFEENHQKFVKGNKSAGGRARKAIGDIKKHVTLYRKQSVEVAKTIKK
jgi:hypothetical protein